jgi:NAD(P) transhydrogenase subunit alpha
VTLMAPLNLPVTVPVHASRLYSRNISNFLNLIVKDGKLALDFNDEILAGACVAHAGEVRNTRVAAVLEAATAGQISS